MACLCEGQDEATCPAQVIPLTPRRFKLGQVVVTEGERDSIISRLIRWATGSWWTHCFVVSGPDEITEAWFPKVRQSKLSDRLRKLQKEGRAYAVLDLPGVTARQRCQIARTARSFLGRFYDVGQVLCFAIFRRFVLRDGVGTIMCSRLVTGAYASIEEHLFDVETIHKQFGAGYSRTENLLEDECVPADLLRSRLRIAWWRRSQTIRNWKTG